METSSTLAGSSIISDTLASTNVPSLSSAVPSIQPTTRIIPGTTVIGTGSTGDVWSYTIPDLTTVIAPSLSAAPTSDPALTSTPAPISTPVPESSLVVTNIIISGTTVTGGMETSVPWSYTIPDATVLSSYYVPISATPTPSLAPSSSTDPIATSSGTPLPPPRPDNAPPTNKAVLSGGIVAAIFVALLLLMFAIAGFLWLRIRKRRLRGDRDKGVGAVWGQGWGSEKGNTGWRKIGPVRPGGPGTEVAGNGYLGGPASDSRQDLRPNPGINGSAEVLDGRPSAHQERSPPPLLSVQIPSHPNARVSPVSDTTYPSRAQYPHTHNGSDTNVNANVQTRTTTSQPHDMHDPNAATKKPTSPSTAPPAKLKRPIPPPSPFVYAPPPEDPPEPSPTNTTSTHPYSYRPTSPRPFRPTSPYGGLNPPPQNVPKRLSKQRVSPSASAFLRHMMPARGASLRRPKVTFTPAPPTSESVTGTATPSSVSVRPNMAALPSFIRERQFSPSHHSNVFAAGSESALFSPSPRPANVPLPPHSPRLGSPYMSRSAPNLVPPPQARSAFSTSRDGFLSPHGYGARDRYSQMTSTTRSGWTGYSRDSRTTGRSGDTRMTGRSGDSRLTGRSGESRLTGRSGGLAQIVEGEREQGSPPSINEWRRRHGGP